MSASNPNLMQIPNPKRGGEKSAEVRTVFEAPKGMKWISSDWKQAEFRVFAHYANDPVVIEEFKSNPDVDYHLLVSELTGLARDPFAKQLNLGLVFGQGQGLTAKKCGLPYTQKMEKGKVYLKAGKEAKKLFEKYHQKLPGVRKMLKSAEETAKRRGYVKTLSGRRIRFYDKEKTYKAAGLVFQGSTADVMKIKLVELNNVFKGTDTELILAVHDEFDALSKNGNVDSSIKIMKSIMEDIPELRIPFRADICAADNWYEASK